MLEKTSQAFRKLIVILIFILAIALLICTLSVLFSVLTLAVIATLTALVIAPKETRQFFAKLAQCVDSWVQAMVSLKILCARIKQKTKRTRLRTIKPLQPKHQKISSCKRDSSYPVSSSNDLSSFSQPKS